MSLRLLPLLGLTGFAALAGRAETADTVFLEAESLASHGGWKPSVTFEEGLAQTIDWYFANEEWLKHVTSGAYQHY